MTASAYRCSSSDYHGRMGYVHASNLLKFVESPLSWYETFVLGIRPKPERTFDMLFGTLTHLFVLEKDKVNDEFCCVPPGLTGRGTKGVVTEWIAENANGREVVMPAVWREAQMLAEALRKSPDTGPWLETAGEVELSIDWRECGLNMTARMDKIFLREPLNAVADVKTSSFLADFEYSIRKWGYDLQAAQYSAAAEAWTGRQAEVSFLVVDKRNKECAVVPMPEDHQAAAQRKRLRILAYIKQCFDTGIWPERGVELRRIEPIADLDFEPPEVKLSDYSASAF